MSGAEAKHRNKPRYGTSALVVLALVLAIGTYLAMERFPSDVRSRQRASSANPHVELIRALTALESALKADMSADEMQQFATRIEAEIEEHPLPEDDDLQFGAALVVRYLRWLGAAQKYRDLKLRTDGYNPLDPKGGHPNKDAIELQAKYSTWLPQRVKALREALSKRRSEARDSSEGGNNGSPASEPR